MGLVDFPGRVRAPPHGIRRPRAVVAVGGRAQGADRQGHRDDLPGSAGEPESLFHRRLPADRNAAHARHPRGARERQAAPRTGAATAAAGRDPGSRGAAGRVSAPALRRHGTAGNDRDGDRLQSAPADRRRTDDRARCDRPGAGARPLAAAAAGARHGAAADHPRSGGRGRDRAARHRHVRRRAGRDRAGAGDLRHAAASVHQGAARRAARAQPRSGAAEGDSRRRARPVRPAGRMPAVAALRFCAGALPASTGRRLPARPDERCAAISRSMPPDGRRMAGPKRRRQRAPWPTSDERRRAAARGRSADSPLRGIARRVSRQGDRARARWRFVHRARRGNACRRRRIGLRQIDAGAPGHDDRAPDLGRD